MRDDSTNRFHLVLTYDTDISIKSDVDIWDAATYFRDDAEARKNLSEHGKFQECGIVQNRPYTTSAWRM